MDSLDRLAEEMIRYDRANPKRIQHLLKVHSFARLIGLKEGLDGDAQFILEAAALTHDIGIKPAEEKYGSHSGKLQEQEGPAPARRMLEALCFAPAVTERVCWLVAHHHTYQNVEGLDHRILLEADALVNLYEDGETKQTIEASIRQVFRTEAGTALCQTMFGVA